MRVDRVSDRISRRGLLSAAAVAGAGIAMPRRAVAADTKPNPVITEVQDWQRQLGDGVDKRAYGSPSKFEQHVIRRHVPWLTAAPESTANFTPLRLSPICFLECAANTGMEWRGAHEGLPRGAEDHQPRRRSQRDTGCEVVAKGGLSLESSLRAKRSNPRLRK